MNEFDVFVAGKRLRKAIPVDPNNTTADYNYYVYDETKDLKILEVMLLLSRIYNTKQYFDCKCLRIILKLKL